MLVHTEMGFMPENLPWQRCHLQSVGVPTQRAPFLCRDGGWMGSLPVAQWQLQLPPLLLGGTGAQGKSVKGCSEHPPDSAQHPMSKP